MVKEYLPVIRRPDQIQARHDGAEQDDHQNASFYREGLIPPASGQEQSNAERQEKQTQAFQEVDDERVGVHGKQFAYRKIIGPGWNLPEGSEQRPSITEKSGPGENAQDALAIRKAIQDAEHTLTAQTA